MPHSRQAVAATAAEAGAAIGAEVVASAAGAAATGAEVATGAVAAATASADCADAHYHRSGSRDSPED